jgi:hypothetical protein
MCSDMCILKDKTLYFNTEDNIDKILNFMKSFIYLRQYQYHHHLLQKT